MKAFVLSNVYSESGDVMCVQARASKWQKLKMKSTICLPPDKDLYSKDIQCNILSGPLQYPIGHGWETLNGKGRPERHTLPLTQTDHIK